ncbi:hypothetical protein ACFYPN_16355 [Streptomyces sp. NPDC005576]|uniref:hypothetical protein n=1 Tax=Streptomyces sp. NPDC005576 TaxID=3364726 RepID=UPI003681F74A
MTIHWGDVATYSTTGASAVIALGAWRSAARSAQEAKRSADTAEDVARIERARWHSDLTPVFEVTLGEEQGGRAGLDVQLLRPLGLQHLDRIELSIANSDDLERTDRFAASPPQEDLDAQVWGPFRFAAGADGADVTGRTVTPISLTVGRGRPFSVERTRPPYWQEGPDREERWTRQWEDKPVKLVIRCRKEGFEPWVVPYTVEVPPPVPSLH